MTSVVFLHDVSDRLRAAASWLSLPRAADACVAVFVPNSQHAEQLDRLLWEQNPTGFTPHCRQQNSLSAETPIVLWADRDAPWPSKTVLNLSDEIPAHLDQIEQLVEIVSQDSETRAAGRTRFRSYQEAGFVVETRNAGKELAR